MGRSPSAILIVVLSVSIIRNASHSHSPLDATTILQRSVMANDRDWQAAPGYNYFERDRQSDGGTKTYEELMILGSPYERLVSVNGLPLSEDKQLQEQQKLEAVITLRRNETESERAKRIAKYDSDRRRDHLLMEQLPKAFDFALIGEQTLRGYEVYVLKATPRIGYHPPSMETEVLSGMQGELWIDKKTFQWVKVQAEVIHPVSIAGFLARVEPGTHFELEKMAIEDDIWLPEHFSMRSRAKVFFLFTRRKQQDETYYGYHQAAAQLEHRGP